MEAYDKEDEDEHSRLLKEQDQHEKQSMSQMPHIDDAEYARMIEMSENFGRGDAKMEDLEINDDEEEKLPRDKRTESRGEHQSISNGEDDGDNEEQDDNQRFLSKQRSAFNTDANPYKKQILPTSSFIKRTAFTQDSESPSKYQTPQRNQNFAPFGEVSRSSNKTNLHPRQDLNEEFRREVVEQVRIRVEELQSKMKSKSDMFYVMRHMCKKHLCLS